tara:strand:- start:1247 stop:1516 length:270 start_codon:yes stop_codon:yes gene_type:complete
MKNFIKKPGSPVHEGEDCILVSNDVPDTIKIPQEVAKMIGAPVGHTPCTDAYVERCICGDAHDVVHYITKHVNVAECPYKGFLWYRKKP